MLIAETYKVDAENICERISIELLAVSLDDFRNGLRMYEATKGMKTAFYQSPERAGTFRAEIYEENSVMELNIIRPYNDLLWTACLRITKELN